MVSKLLSALDFVIVSRLESIIFSRGSFAFPPAHLLIVETPIAAGRRWPSISATSILVSCSSDSFQKTTCFEASELNGSFLNHELPSFYYNG